MKGIAHFLDPRQANKAASCVASQAGGAELADGTFAPAYLCPLSTHRHNICLLSLTSAVAGVPLRCEHYTRYIGPEEIPAEEC